MSTPGQHAYKEWSPIVSALGSGSQILLLRKGGIAEGPGGFRPEHPAFWLYPTLFHPESDKLKTVPPHLPLPLDTPSIPIQFHALVSDVFRLHNPASLSALDAFHLWAPEEITRRWHYGSTPGLFAMIVRVSTLPSPFPLAPSPAYAGCKSWIALEQSPPTSDLRPVQDDPTFEAERQKILQILANPSS
ncbi:MAG: DUF1802 family protein [Candidatus Methylacidiphilales bacterium]|nr:DUF1802 family protein [Candidatus Methylacidiphilales bacterium]